MSTKKKSTKKVNEKIDEKNAKDTVTKVVKTKREVKWKLPAEVKTLKQKRAFRAKGRATLRKMESELLKNPTKKLEREYKRYRKEVLLVP